MSDTSTALDGLRALRRVAPPESPWAGRMARDASGRAVVLVDAARVSFGALWRADPAGHLVAVLDVQRRPDGHDLVLPACVTPLTAYLARREAVPGTRALSTGEGVTVLVSVLRGLRERAALGGSGGGWWLTEDGRPMLVADAVDDSAEVLAAVARCAPALAVEAERMRAAVAAGTSPEDREPELFAVAPGEPLDVPDPHASAPGAGRAEAPPGDTRRGRRLLDGVVDPGLADLWADAAARVAEASTRVRRGLLGLRRAGRARMLVVAGAVVAVVLAIGLLWPAGEDPGAAAPAATTVPSASAGVETAGDPRDVSAPGTGSVTDAAHALLVRAAACSQTCGEIREDAQRALTTTLPPGEPRVALVEDFGDVAVVRATYPGATVLAVIARGDERWRLRDVYTAEPP